MSELSSAQVSLANRATALGALMQCVSLVEQIARKGECDHDDFQCCINSLFHNGSSQHVAEHYGGIRHLQHGLHLANRLMTGQQVDNAKALYSYSAGLMALEKKLGKSPEVLKKLADGMQRVSKQVEYFHSQHHENVIAGIAGVYGETISTIKPRIIVRGKSEHLRISDNTHQIRTLLLAGIRAAHLWHKNGGSHLKLLLQRKKLAAEMLRLIEQSKSA